VTYGRGRTPTSAEDKTANANAVGATLNDVKTFRNEVRIHISSGKTCPNFDGPLFLVEDDIAETTHRDMDTNDWLTKNRDE